MLLLHLLLCIYCVVTPDRFIPRNSVTTIYRNLILLGPFFTESRILDSHYLSYRYKIADSWSDVRHLSREHFALYSEVPWRIDHLSAINYERYLLRSMHETANGYSFQEVRKTKPFRELNSFLVNEVVTQPTDSTQITYTTDRYLPDTKSFALDTVFTFIYNPKSIAAVTK